MEKHAGDTVHPQITSLLVPAIKIITIFDECISLSQQSLEMSG